MRNDASEQVPCPECGQSAGKQLVTLSVIAYADYFQCQTCEHVWQVERPLEEHTLPDPLEAAGLDAATI